MHSYAVEEVLPFHLKALRALLRDRGVGTLTIKKRGSAVDPVQLRRQLRLTGDGEATIALTRVGGRPQRAAAAPGAGSTPVERLSRCSRARRTARGCAAPTRTPAR